MDAKPIPAKTILIVEELAPVRHALTALLEEAGHTVRSAANCLEALQQLRAGPPPDLILLDVKMPTTATRQFRLVQQNDPALASIPLLAIPAGGDLKEKMQAIGVIDRGDAECEQQLDLELTTPKNPGILVVEDDQGVRDMLGLALGHYGFAAWLAATGQEAVSLYEQHRDAIALVLLDVQMPDMDGPQTLAALRTLNPRLPCCFMTGNIGIYEAEDLLSLGAACVLEKPFRIKNLTEMVRKLVG